MTPFQLAWGFLKAESKPKPMPNDYLYDGTNAQQLRDLFNETSAQMAEMQFLAREKEEAELMSKLMSGEPLSTVEMTRLLGYDDEPRRPNPNIELRDQNHPAPKPATMESTRQTRLPGTDEPNRHDIEMKNAERRLADQKAEARAHLNQHIPRLYRSKRDGDGMNYAMMAGGKDLGHIGVDRFESMSWPVGTKEPAEEYGIGYAEVNRPYQRQGLYGSALQGIINDTGSLSSIARNRQSGPFHEQFNPPNVDRRRSALPGLHETDKSQINYTQQPPKETPRDWGDLQYETGAMPVFEDKGPLQPPALNPRDREQASLARWGYIPGEQTYN